jgi:hypothetical protein
LDRGTVLEPAGDVLLHEEQMRGMLAKARQSPMLSKSATTT